MSTAAKTLIGVGCWFCWRLGVGVVGMSGGFDWSGGGALGGGGGETTVSAPEAQAPATQPVVVAAAVARGPIYNADLSGKMPAEFHGGMMRKTKQGNRRYIAQTGTGGTAFTLTDMPPHAFVHVTFDLALLNSWNGCNADWGPDIWTASIVGGPELLRTTFSNCGMFSDNNEQNYPDMYLAADGVAPHPAWTGALEHGTLGEMHSWGGADRTFDCSAIYHMDWTFPHADSTLKINFVSKTKKRDKLFGLLSFHLDTLAGGVPLSDEQFKQAWTDISSDDAVVANAAVWRMIGAGDAAVAMLKGEDLTKLNDYPLSRVRHVLAVVNTAGAQELAAKLP